MNGGREERRQIPPRRMHLKPEQCVRARQRTSVSQAGPLRLLVITAHLSECYSTWLG